jgi:uncharacterized protein YbaA (DUF1428 family)
VPDRSRCLRGKRQRRPDKVNAVGAASGFESLDLFRRRRGADRQTFPGRGSAYRADKPFEIAARRDRQKCRPALRHDGKCVRDISRREQRLVGAQLNVAAVDVHAQFPRQNVKVGKLTSFPRSVKLRRGETVVFSWIIYPSRAARDRINAKVMSDPRIKKMGTAAQMPFDAKRMIYGGFKTIVTI